MVTQSEATQKTHGNKSRLVLQDDLKKMKKRDTSKLSKDGGDSSVQMRLKKKDSRTDRKRRREEEEEEEAGRKRSKDERKATRSGQKRKKISDGEPKMKKQLNW